MKLTSIIQIFTPFSGGYVVTIINPPFFVETGDAFVSGAIVGSWFSQGAEAMDSYNPGAVAGSSHG